MEMNNMEIYEYAKSVPDYAKKPISGGRLNGKTDIRPQWRTQVLTEIFGPCGFGWWYEITSQRLEKGEGKEVKAFVDINLYVKWGEQVSQPIPGIGGNSYIDNKGYVNDECFKMALTDAISVAAKALGVGADVYMGAENTKYTREDDERIATAPAEPRNDRRAPPPPREAGGPMRASAPTDNSTVQLPPTAADGYWYCDDCKNMIGRVQKNDGTWLTPPQIVSMGLRRYKACLCPDCMKKREAQRA